MYRCTRYEIYSQIYTSLNIPNNNTSCLSGDNCIRLRSKLCWLPILDTVKLPLCFARASCPWLIMYPSIAYINTNLNMCICIITIYIYVYVWMYMYVYIYKFANIRIHLYSYIKFSCQYRCKYVYT